MFNIGGGFSVISFDEKLYTRRLDRTMGQILREAAREWLRAVLTSVPERGGFPVLTGESKSSLVPLGRLLKNVGNLRVTPQPGQKDKRAEGEAQSSFIISDSNFEYIFAWNSDVVQYLINEYNGLIPFAPWHSLEAGRQAFLIYVNEALLTRVPQVIDYVEIIDPGS